METPYLENKVDTWRRKMGTGGGGRPNLKVGRAECVLPPPNGKVLGHLISGILSDVLWILCTH